MRKLVTVRKIADILPIEGADRIEQILIDGWRVVAQKGIYTKSNDILFFEIDSFLPSTDSRYDSFMKFGTRTFEGVLGHRIKTIRLKGIYSQGVIMPLSEFPEITDPDGDIDYSELLGIVKYEKQESTGFKGDTKGTFPWFLRKTDQERIQNCYGYFTAKHYNDKFVGTLKLDGCSISAYYVLGEPYGDLGHGLCSRNQELKLDWSKPVLEQGNFIQGYHNSGLTSKLEDLHDKYGSYYAIQGELVGTGIQGNFEKFEKYQVFAFDIFDIVKQEYVDYNTFVQMAEYVDLQTVPIVYEGQYIVRESLQDILELANGTGLKADYREGIVWKQIDGTASFKSISNRYLSKED